MDAITTKNNEVTNFMYYVFNDWNKEEAELLFGQNLGQHIYGKWVYCRERRLGDLWWYSELDNDCRQKIVDRANQLHNNN